MPNNSGVFSLSSYYDKDLSGNIPDRSREAFREYGYFGGGGTPTVSTVNRVDYSNDTTTTSVRGPLSGARRYFAGTGNSNFGYFSSSNSSIDRINYSNDNAITSVRGPLSLYRSDFAATGNNNFGYFGAGYTPSVPNVRSIVDRIDYSNDNTTALVRGSLSKSRYGLLATGNSNFGYYTDGYPDGSALCDRINYSNDSVVALVRGSLIQSKQYGGATGNSNFGYFGGGLGGGTSTERSSISRVTYSNDTVTSSPRGPLSLSRRAVAATGNSNFGYFGGGNPQPATPRYSTIDRIDYSNDTATASVRGGIGSRRYHSATGNSNFGYFGGGGGPIATVNRIDYANDTAQASTRGPLSLARGDLAATTNARNS